MSRRLPMQLKNLVVAEAKPIPRERVVHSNVPANGNNHNSDQRVFHMSQNQLNSTIESMETELNLPSERQRKIWEGLSSLAHDPQVQNVVAKHPGYWVVIEQLQQTNSIQTLATNPIGLITQDAEREKEPSQGPGSPPPKANLPNENSKIKKQEPKANVASNDSQHQTQQNSSQKAEQSDDEEGSESVKAKSLYNILLENISRYVTTLLSWVLPESSKSSTAMPTTQPQTNHDEQQHPYLRSFVVVGVAFILIAAILRSDPSKFKLSVEEGKDFSRQLLAAALERLASPSKVAPNHF